MSQCIECVGKTPEPTSKELAFIMAAMEPAYWKDKILASLGTTVYPPQLSEEQNISLEKQEERNHAALNTPSNT